MGTVGRERRDLGLRIRQLHTPAPVDVGVTDTALVTAPGMTRYHRPDCDVVRGKPTRTVSPADLQGGLTTCGMCQP
jgi:hypothetical protein